MSKRKLCDFEDIDTYENNDLIDIWNSSSDNDSSEIVYPVTELCEQVIEEDFNDNEHQITQPPEQWTWEEKNNVPKIWKYTEISRIKEEILSQLNETERGLDIFNVIFDIRFWENIVNETNRYAQQLMQNKNKRRKIDNTWFPVDCNEMKIYFALCIIMAQVKKPTIQMNWSKRAVIETPIFRKTMPLKRFLQITRCLHFASNNKIDNSDKLRKIKPVTNFLNKKFKEVYIMKEDIAINESLIKFKGRLSYKQYNPSKRARFGIKFYKLCESETGYCYDFKIYTGSEKIHANEIASENIVKELSQSVLQKGHTLYLNSWHSSPRLFATLVENKTNAIGTVHSNRKNMPTDFIKARLKRGEFRTRSCNGILALKWRDKKNVYIISTKHETVEMNDFDKHQLHSTLKPKCLIEYTKGMIGVERQDQMLACYPVMRKNAKGYRKVFFYVCDIALFNSYILFNKINTGKKQSYPEYRIEIAESLLKNVPIPEYNARGRLSSGDLPQRLHAQHWGHFPKHIDPTPSKTKPSRACKVCSRHKKRSETTWECKKCKVALHIPLCFETYHTVEDY